jgi:hypothetical protein
MHPMIFPTLLIVAGAYFLVRNIRFLLNKTALHDYVMTSSKAHYWLKAYGEKTTLEYTRKYFVPLGIVTALIMLAIGVWSIWELGPHYLW